MTAIVGDATEVLSPATYEEAADLVRDAEASGRKLIPSGLGNHLGLASALPRGAAVLSLTRLAKIVRYEPDDFTAGVQAGIPLDALRSELAQNRQEIPVDFAASPRGTIGGALAQNRAGPRRGRSGTLRPYLIGTMGLRGGGRIYRAGGMVVKNVAGFDVMKLLIGSAGAFGAILEANFKLRPIPAARSLRRVRFPSASGAWKLAREIRLRALEPAVLSVLDPGADAALASALGSKGSAAWSIIWSFEGNSGTVKWLEAEADRLLLESDTADAEATAFEQRERESAIEFLASVREVDAADRARTLVLSVATLPSDGESAAVALAGALESGGCLVSDATSGFHSVRWSVDDRHPAARAGKLIADVRSIAERLRASGRVLCAPPALHGENPLARAWSLVPEAAPALHRRFRQAFDPRGVFGAWPEEAARGVS